MLQSESYPICGYCGGHNLSLEALVVWSDESRQPEVVGLTDKGHYCCDCDKETTIEWRDYA